MKCTDCESSASYKCCKCEYPLCSDCFTSTSSCAKCMHERSKRLAFLKSEAAFILIKYLQDGELQYDENGDYVVADHYNVHHPDIPSFVTEEQRQFFLSLTPDDITQIYINHTESTMF